MKISILLKVKSKREILERVSKDNNDLYLVKGPSNLSYPYLSEVENYDHSIYDITDMDGVIDELLRVREELLVTEDQQHIDDIICLAEKCKKTPDTVLVFAG